MLFASKKAVAVIAPLIWAIAYFGSASFLRGKTQIQDNDPLSKWRSHDYPGVQYVGRTRCAECHTYQASTQPETPMAHALEPVADCQVLSTHERLTFRNGPYSYEITRQRNGSTYTVTDGVKTISEPLLYCFGLGKVGQTYVFKHNGSFYETRVSYYPAVGGLDFTTSHSHQVPTSVDEALGRPVGPDEERGCFGCHAPAAVNESGLHLDSLIPGVTCESCHGPGGEHIAAVKARKLKDLHIFNPGKLNPNDLSQEFCGSCHRSFDNVMLMPKQGGLNNVRFQPYRIFNSHGHNSSDPRISCIACHDPHLKLEREAASYDSKCLACHLSSVTEARTDKRAAPPCPVSNRLCATCHMPKVDIPEMHFKFTDHWIRIARPNDPVPR
jgi:hypothetical protein